MMKLPMTSFPAHQKPTISFNPRLEIPKSTATGGRLECQVRLSGEAENPAVLPR